ncbi:MAG: o-succinylbenzoate synthase [Chloroflexi bacterium]|nr:o-succinylbenzoate synthase [Chloroflexota bacterium]MQC48465.1 o-succinylbenzoate synthase [Chloroflexota bacterium]
MTTPIRIRWRPFRLPMHHRFEAAHGALDDREGVLVQLVDASGLAGTGEASPMPSLGQGRASDVIALLDAYAPALLAGEPVPDGPGANSLRCALDVAGLDLRGRASGRPVAAALTEAQPAAWVQANAVIGSGEPDEVARYAAEAWATGYRVLKLKVGAAEVSTDVARVSAVRDACPQATIRLDANGAWDEATALVALHALVPFHVELIEQPVPAADVEALARIRERSPMRIAADEAVTDAATLRQVLDLRAADLVVLKPMLLGGITPALEVAHRAFERGIGAFATTTFDSSIGTAAALHLAAALPWDAAHGLGTGDHLAGDVTASTLLPASGRLMLPTGAGLGVEVDEHALEAVATAPWSEAEA